MHGAAPHVENRYRHGGTGPVRQAYRRSQRQDGGAHGGPLPRGGTPVADHPRRRQARGDKHHRGDRDRHEALRQWRKACRMGGTASQKRRERRQVQEHGDNQGRGTPQAHTSPVRMERGEGQGQQVPAVLHKALCPQVGQEGHHRNRPQAARHGIRASAQSRGVFAE